MSLTIHIIIVSIGVNIIMGMIRHLTKLSKLDAEITSLHHDIKELVEEVKKEKGLRNKT